MTPSRLSLTFLILTLSFVFIHAQEQDNGQRNDLVVGVREPKDYLIQREAVKVDPGFENVFKASYERTFTGNNNAIITQYRALDQHPNGHGATAIPIGGGVGENYVTLKFKPELFRGIDFIVELYGKPRIPNA